MTSAAAISGLLSLALFGMVAWPCQACWIDLFGDWRDFTEGVEWADMKKIIRSILDGFCRKKEPPWDQATARSDVFSKALCLKKESFGIDGVLGRELLGKLHGL